MYAEERQSSIAALISENGRVSVAKIADRFSVTPETVRRDLDALAAAGVVRRVHGGALPVQRQPQIESAVAERETLHSAGKERIARAALKFLPDTHGSIAVDGGTTTSRLVNSLATRTLTVVTNSVPALHRLSSSSSIRLHTVGGRIRHETSAIVGIAAAEEIRRLRVDVTFVGTNGISADHGLSTPDLEEAAIKSAMLDAAKLRVLLTDGSKFNIEHVHRFAELAEFDVMITDVAPPEELAQALAEHEIEVVVA